MWKIKENNDDDWSCLASFEKVTKENHELSDDRIDQLQMHTENLNISECALEEKLLQQPQCSISNDQTSSSGGSQLWQIEIIRCHNGLYYLGALRDNPDQQLTTGQIAGTAVFEVLSHKQDI